MKFEHLIYGTFPDLPGSQQVVYKSSGTSPEIESWLIQQYDQFGDCKTEEFRSSLTLQWYRESESPLAILTKVTHAGQDFSGRWGALLRHSAIVTQAQFFAMFGDVGPIADKLVSSGTSEELSQSSELEIESIPDQNAIVESILSLNLAHFESNMKRILTGERLVLYADLNTPHLTNYLRGLLSLLPLSIRAKLNWSEFIFHSLPEMDLSVVHSSRYSAPDSDIIEFQSDGENGIGGTLMSVETAEEFISNLSTAIGSKDTEKLAALLLLES